MSYVVPRECWTCRHRRTIEYGPALAAGIIEQQCSKFVRQDRFGETTPLTCLEAHDRFCGGGDWQPSIRARIMRFFGIAIP